MEREHAEGRRSTESTEGRTVDDWSEQRREEVAVPLRGSDDDEVYNLPHTD